MSNRTGLIAILAFAWGPILLVSSSAIADTVESGTTVETVVVTAERRAEPLYQVPATVTAIPGDQLRDLGYTDMKSVVALVPNAVLPNDPENFETYVNIRGIHQSDINAEPNYGFYRNGIYDGGERANLGSQVDIGRVEILSGPQSGLYGRDAVGGVVDVYYATPSFDDTNGYAIASYNSYERADLEGAINIPLANNFAIRPVAWWIDQRQGQIYNPTLHSYIDTLRDIGGRLSARWDPTSRLSIIALGEYQDVHGPSFTAYAPNGIGGVFGVQCCGLPVQGPETLHTVYEDTPNTEHWQQFYLSGDATYDTGSWAGSFELQGSYRLYHLFLQEDQDHTAFSPNAYPMMIQSVQYRYEKLHNAYGQLIWRSPTDQRLTWIAGADYFDETFDFARVFAGSVNFNLLNTPAFGPFFTYGNLLCSFLMAPYDGGCEGNGGFPGLPGAGSGSYPYLFPNIGLQSAANAFGGPGSFINTQSESLFASATYNVTDALSVTGTLRWDQTKKSLNYLNGAVPGYGATALGSTYLVPLFEQIFVPFHSAQSRTFSNLSPSVNVKYALSDTANLYAVYATGFRSGGYNVTTSTAAFLPYKPELAQNYEVGAKTLWLGGRLGVNGDVFYMTQNHLLEPQSDPTEPAFLGLYYLANVGRTRTYGAELSAVYQAFDWMDVGATVGWLDDKFTGGSSHGLPLKGQEIPLTRNWTLNFSDNVVYPISADIDFVANANWHLEYGGWLPACCAAGQYVYETVRYKSFNDLDLDAGISYGNTRIVGFVRNAFDSVIPQFQYSVGVENVNQGRTYGIRIEQKF